MTLGDLLVKVGVTGLPAFQTAMGGVSATLNKTLREADKSFSGFEKLGGVMKDVGSQLTVGLTLPIVAAGAAAFKFASDFDGAMRQVTSLLGSVSQSEFKALSDATLELSQRMGVDAVDSAHALYEALSANVPKENVMEFLEVATGTAIAGVTNTKVAVDGLTTVINSYGLAAEEAGAVSDAMFQAVNFGKVTFEELASSVGLAASGASSMGISYDELLGTMSAITLQGRSSSEAFTEINSAITALLSPNAKMNELLDETGFATGKALIEAKGFAGALQELQTASKGNNETLVDAMGKAEAYRAVLHTTGEGAELVSKSLGLMTQKLGATATAQSEIEKSAPFMWEKFKNQLEAVAIMAGQQLLPAFQSLLAGLTPLIMSISGGVKWFADLSTISKTLIVGFAGLLASIGPLLLVTGQLMGSFAGIASAVTAASGIMSTFPAVMGAVSTALGLAGPLAIAFGVAIAGWAIYEAVQKLQALNKELDATFEMQSRGVKASEEQGASISALTGILENYNKQVAVTGGTAIKLPNFSDFAKAADPIKAYIDALTEAAKKLPTYSETAAASLETLKKGGTIVIGQAEAIAKAIKEQIEAQKKASAQAEANRKAIEAQEKAEKALSDAISKSQDNLKKTEELYKSGKATMSDVIKASDAYNKLLKEQDDRFLKLHPTLGKVDTSMNSINEASGRTAAVLMEQLNPSLLSSYTNFEKLNAKMYLNAGAWEMVLQSMDPLPDAIVDAGVSLDKLNGSMRSSTAPAYTLSDAIKEVGTKAPEEFGRLASAAEEVYDQLSESFPAASSIVKDAFRKMQEAKIAYERSLGNNDVADALENQLGAHKEHGEKVETVWGRTAKQVSTIISDMGKNFASGIMKLFDNSENNKLDEQMAELRSSLADKTTAYQDHVSDVNAKLAEIPVAYDSAISDLEMVTSTKLASIDDEYSDSIKGLKKKFQEVTESAAKQLDKQLKDLDEQLRDKKQNYDRSTQDANTSYKRDTENLRESLDDKEREYRQWVEEQNQNLRQLEGDNSASAERQRQDIRLAMQHRAEDMEDARADTQAALLREEEDLALSLKRKQDDYAADLAEIKTKQDEATANYKKTLDDANTELETSLADRQAEYLKDKTAAIDTYEEAKAEIIKKYGEQTQALKDELGNALKEYDTYRSGIETKLAELEAAHKGPLDRIGTMFTDIFKGAGEALLRFAGEEFMGLLMGKLKGILDFIPGIGSAISGLFGGGGGGNKSIAETAMGGLPLTNIFGNGALFGGGSGISSGAGSAIAGGAGGFLQIFNAVTGAVSAIANVLQLFGVGQGGQKDRLGQISDATTYVAKVYGDMGLKDALQGMANNIAAYVSSHDGWVHDSWVELLDASGSLKSNVEALRWYADDTHRRIGEIRDSINSRLPELTAIKLALQTMPPPIVNVYVQGDLPNLVTKITTEINKGMALQGA